MHKPQTPDVIRSIQLLELALSSYRPRDFAIRLWDGAVMGADEGQPARFTLVLQHAGALRRMLWRANQVTLSEAYLYNDFDIEGDISALFQFGDFLLRSPLDARTKFRIAQTLLALPSNAKRTAGRPPARLRGLIHSKERDRQAVAYHYNVSNDFFALWLDPMMVYSCAYYHQPNDSLDTAQEQKLAHICRKLRLRPGERLLDLGCGWGGLLIYAAKHFGVEAVGITLSEPQAQLANERIRRAGLTGRCAVKILDYRESESLGVFDKIVSVGMFEHVGEQMLPEYFHRTWRLLRPGGVFLNHGIGFTAPQPPNHKPTFFHHYVFPDGELVPLSVTLRAAEAIGFEVRDVESLREHYILTLRQWIARLETNYATALSLTDEITFRVWRLYLGAAVHQFVTARANLFQVLLSKTFEGKAELPLTRLDWYLDSEEPRRN